MAQSKQVSGLALSHHGSRNQRSIASFFSPRVEKCTGKVATKSVHKHVEPLQKKTVSPGFDQVSDIHKTPVLPTSSHSTQVSANAGCEHFKTTDKNSSKVDNQQQKSCVSPDVVTPTPSETTTAIAKMRKSTSTVSKKSMSKRASPVVEGTSGLSPLNVKKLKLVDTVVDEDDEVQTFHKAKRARRKVIYDESEEEEVDKPVDDDSQDEDWASGKEAATAKMVSDSDPDDDGDSLDDEDNDEDDVISKKRKSRPKRPYKAQGKSSPRSRGILVGQAKTSKNNKAKRDLHSSDRHNPVAVELKANQATSRHDFKVGADFSICQKRYDSNSQSSAKESTLLGAGFDADLAGEAAERFGSRNAEKFPFLTREVRDASGRKRGDPQYDSRTLYLPKAFVDKLTGGQRQWWQFKAMHMDKVLFFKMGKFYEMFEMDAHIGAQELDLQYMKGDQPHCGFPEKNYSENAERLARKGYRVLVVEQTETPAQLELRKKETSSKDKVVKREICAILTKGTIVDGEMLESSPDPAYLLAVTERVDNQVLGNVDKAVEKATIGVCAVDAATGLFMLGQFEDDSVRTQLRSVLSELRPVELLKPRAMLSEAAERALRDHTRSPLVNYLAPGAEFWDAETTLRETSPLVRSVVEDDSLSEQGTGRVSSCNSWPATIGQLIAAGSGGEAALSALGACTWYLRQALIDKRLLAMRHFQLLPGCEGNVRGPNMENKGAGSQSGEMDENADEDDCLTASGMEPVMILDSAALENLEILENNKDGGLSGTLLSQLDNCATAVGRRLLRKWLVRPLLRVGAIRQRQMAVADLKGVAAEALGKFRRQLAGFPDMERLLARLCASSGVGGGQGRNAENVVLYEDNALKHVKEFTSALRGCLAMCQAVDLFADCKSKLTSDQLLSLVTPGKRFPDVLKQLQHFEEAFDWQEAESSGRIIPTQGVDAGFDDVSRAVELVQAELEEYLQMQRKLLGNPTEMAYQTVGKDPYQMEVPERLHTRVPKEYEVKSQKKGFRRYWTPAIREMIGRLTTAQEQREEALRGILAALRTSFCTHLELWTAAVQAVAEVDVLGSLALSSLYIDGPSCCPSFRPPDKALSGGSSARNDASWIHAKSLRHPVIGGGAATGAAFVPNDTILGGGQGKPSFMLLTGPNMGGKSTLLRQVCLAVILAQIGADVPAESFSLSAVDRVFVRMGARDQIMAAQSTFLVELSETATMLRSATRRSLVALDELGRGTATSDGQAIAHAVLRHLAHSVGCLGMFSTHYHRLANDHASDPRVVLRHMACQVGPGRHGVDEVTFLYKLTEGACPKSYGVNVARLAGMPDKVLIRAAHKAAAMEEISNSKASSSETSRGDEAAMAEAGLELSKEELSLFTALRQVDTVRAGLEDLGEAEVALLATQMRGMWQAAREVAVR